MRSPATCPIGADADDRNVAEAVASDEVRQERKPSSVEDD
jgi:hypothetical protein